MFNSVNIYRIKFVLMIVLVISLPFSESIKSIALFLLAAVFFVQLYRKEITCKISMIHLAFLGLMLSAFISSMLAENMAKGLKGFYDMTYCAIAFFVAASIKDEKQSRAILWGLYASTAAAVIIGIAHAIQVNGPIQIHQLRNPNYIAMYLIIVLCCMISTLILSDRDKLYSRIIVAVFALIVLWGSILTEYRASFIGLFMLIVMLIFVKKNIKHSLAIGAMLLSVCILGVFLYKPLWDKITTTNSLVARFYLWEGAFEYFKAHPLFGIGPNHYSYLHPAGSPTAGGINTDAHSIYMNTLAQTGLAGFVSLILLMYGFMREFFGARTINGFGTSLRYCALGAFLVTFASGFFDSTFHHSPGILFSLLLGLFVGNSGEVMPGRKPESPAN